MPACSSARWPRRRCCRAPRRAALLGLLAAGQGTPALLVAVATIGNVLGSTVELGAGAVPRGLPRPLVVPVRGRSFERGVDWFRRWGAWSLLLSWLPVVGDPLTAAAGVLRVGLGRFLVLVTIGKAARYLFVAGAFLWWAGDG